MLIKVSSVLCCCLSVCFTVSAAAGVVDLVCATPGIATPLPSLSLEPSLVVRLKRGCVWQTAPVLVDQPGVRFEAYGDGDSPPAITGTVTIPPSLWQPASGRAGTWVAVVDTGGIRPAEPLLLVNSSIAQHARFPLASASPPWLRVAQDLSNATSVSWRDAALAGRPDGAFVGATARVRCSSYYYCSALIASSSTDGTLVMDASTILPSVAQWHSPPGTGYFLDGLVAFLAAPLDWVYETMTSTVVLKSEVDPRLGGVRVELAVAEHAFVGNTSCDGLSVDGVAVYGFTKGALLAQGCNNVSVQNVVIRAVGQCAVAVSGNGTRVTNTSISQAAGSAVQVGGTAGGSANGYDSGAVLAHNTLTDIGTRDGYGLMGPGGYTAVTSGRGAWVHHNVVAGVGYHGISMGADSVYERNALMSLCTVLNDGGALYSWNNAPPYDNVNITVRYNFVTGVLGNVDSMVPGSEPAWGRGVYVDDRLTGVTILGNTISDVGNVCIFVHGGLNVSVVGNTAFNCTEAGVGFQDEGDEPMVGNVAAGNTVVSFGTGAAGVQACVEETSQVNVSTFHLASYGPGNVCASPYSNALAAWRRIVQFRTGYVGPQAVFDAASWRAVSGGDPGLTTLPSTVPLRLPYTAITPTGPSVLPFGALNSSADVGRWRAIPATVASTVLDPVPPADGFLAGGALRFSMSYGQPAALLASPALQQDASGAPYLLVSATLASASRPWPNPGVALLSVSVGRFADVTSSPGVPASGLWTAVARVPNPPTPGLPLPAAQRFVAVLPSPGNGTVGSCPTDACLFFAVPSFVSLPVWVGNVTVTPILALAETVPLERLFSNPSDAVLGVSIAGRLYQDVLRAGRVQRCSVQLPPWSSAVLVDVGPDPQPCGS